MTTGFENLGGDYCLVHQRGFMEQCRECESDATIELLREELVTTRAEVREHKERRLASYANVDYVERKLEEVEAQRDSLAASLEEAIMAQDGDAQLIVERDAASAELSELRARVEAARQRFLEIAVDHGHLIDWGLGAELDEGLAILAPPEAPEEETT